MQRTFMQFFKKKQDWCLYMCWKMPEFINAHQKEEKILCVLWTVYRTYSDRDYNECCGMKYKTTEQENIL